MACFRYVHLCSGTVKRCIVLYLWIAGIGLLEQGDFEERSASVGDSANMGTDVLLDWQQETKKHRF